MGERIGFLGAGDVYIRAKVDGVWSGYVNSGGATKFEIKAEAETKEQVDKGKSTYGQKVDAVTIPQNATFAATFTRPAKPRPLGRHSNWRTGMCHRLSSERMWRGRTIPWTQKPAWSQI